MDVIIMLVFLKAVLAYMCLQHVVFHMAPSTLSQQCLSVGMATAFVYYAVLSSRPTVSKTQQMLCVSACETTEHVFVLLL